MKITKQHIAIYRNAGACSAALDWAEAAPRTYAEAPGTWRYSAAGNPSTPAKALTELAKDSSSDVRSWAAGLEEL